MTATDTATEATTDRTEALTSSLLAAGWSYTCEVRTEPQWRSQIHELASPDGRLHLHASRYPDGDMIASLSADSASTTGPGRRPGWMAELHEVPLPVALRRGHAARARLDTTRGHHRARPRTGARLGQPGPRPHRVPPLPGNKFEPGYWLVGRPGPDGKHAETQISLHTPAAVIAALALTD
ncbi:hypothetical protein Caci_4073 [Catenulispora acidiphila DSM 44928]|uniref:Uncharacterized protein n=1 Tax=Catenulispora acidiphila (strain DSM 44928 / JCM 14897 / NBRC 102108 / NRRL B-24433 / ID139908) TaxID=479433 RepID=C7QG93_CATAD|nr:hypothetical protein [Catenulispora acidiphila]ACU72938.1 hypothetical protein Caci_4073 [Catenulispora acidiphila DSM 44928]